MIYIKSKERDFVEKELSCTYVGVNKGNEYYINEEYLIQINSNTLELKLLNSKYKELDNIDYTDFINQNYESVYVKDNELLKLFENEEVLIYYSEQYDFYEYRTSEGVGRYVEEYHNTLYGAMNEYLELSEKTMQEIFLCEVSKHYNNHIHFIFCNEFYVIYKLSSFKDKTMQCNNMVVYKVELDEFTECLNEVYVGTTNYFPSMEDNEEEIINRAIKEFL